VDQAESQHQEHGYHGLVHHVPRPEDWPQMPIMWHTFTPLPYQFLPRNPTMDLPIVP
jgi:Cu2+-containing amine oxidase